MTIDDPWFLCPKPNANADFRLFCFHFAGGGASMYHSWADALPSNVEICALRLPGRESRYTEPRLQSIDAMVKAIVKVIVPYLDRPFAFFGYSLGALLAFELVRELRQQSMPLPIHLFLAAARAPHMPRTHAPLGELSDEDFIAAIHYYYQPNSEVWAIPELVEMLLPVLRDDMKAGECYKYELNELLDCSIDLYAGENDLSVPLDNILAWQELTTGDCQTTLYLGNHFFIEQCLAELLDSVNNRLRTLTAMTKSCV